jgi:hypothetical protein
VKDTYKMELFCGNCEDSPKVQIPKGQGVSEYCLNSACPICGCKHLHRQKPYDHEYIRHREMLDAVREARELLREKRESEREPRT